MVDANFAERRNAAPHIPKAWKDISQQVTSLPDQASRQDFVRGLFQAADSRFASAFAEDTDGQSRSVALRDIVHHFMNPNVAALSLLEDSTVDQWLAQYCPTISGDEDEQEQTSGKANPEGDAKRNRQVRDYQRAIFTNTAFWGLMAYRDGTTEWPWAEKRPWFMKRDVVMTMPGMKRRGRGIRSITDDGKTILDLLEECEAKLEVYRQEQKQRAIDGSASPMDTSEDFESECIALLDGKVANSYLQTQMSLLRTIPFRSRLPGGVRLTFRDFPRVSFQGQCCKTGRLG